MPTRVRWLQDPHGELTKQNVLIVKGSLEATATKFGLSADDTRAVLESARAKLWETRLKRPRPHLDNKIVTSWNGTLLNMFFLRFQLSSSL